MDFEFGENPQASTIEPLSDHFDAVKGVSYKGSGLGESRMPLNNLNSVYERDRYRLRENGFEVRFGCSTSASCESTDARRTSRRSHTDGLGAGRAISTEWAAARVIRKAEVVGRRDHNRSRFDPSTEAKSETAPHRKVVREIVLCIDSER